MKTLILLFISSLLILSSCEKDGAKQEISIGLEPTADTCTIVTKFIADGIDYDSDCIGYEIGNITVVDDGNYVTVTFNVTIEDCLLNATHLYIGPETDIPANKPGNATPGHFPYNTSHTPGVTTYTIGPIDVPVGDYVIAAHADLSMDIVVPTLDSLCGLLPETVDFVFTEKGPDSYLNIDITNGDWLNGTYQGWCIDLEHSIVDGTYYADADVYCSYETLPDGLVDHPENIDLVNWIINNVSVGQASACGDSYTWGDIQRAIWELMDDENNEIGLDEWSQCRADEVVTNATANGEGYVAECGGYLGVILDAGEDVQTVLIAVPASCSIGEIDTEAWGYGQNGEYCDPDGATGISFTDSEYYGGIKWGWYFYECE